MKITKKRIVKVAFYAIALLVVIAQVSYWGVAICANGRMYDSVNDIPYNEVGMLLGTGPITITGEPSPFFQYRIDAAEELYKAGKVKFILISGDNSREDYSEPDIMRDSLIARGVPEESIYLDYAGFRTWDSVIRADKVFGQKKMTVISQQFHNERSIFIGDRFGMELIGFNAKDKSSRLNIVRAYIRENFARVKIFVDLLIDKQPHFLGEPIEIGEGKPQEGTKLTLVDKKRTCRWLANELNKSENTVSRWCSNKTQPSLQQLYEISTILGVDMSELIKTPTEQ